MSLKNLRERLRKGMVTAAIAGAFFLNQYPSNQADEVPVQVSQEVSAQISQEIPSKSQKEYTITIDRPYETVLEAFQEIMPGAGEKAYLASLQAKEANNWYTWLSAGEYKVMIDENKLNEDFKKAIAGQEEYLLDWRVDESRKEELLENAVNRVTGFNDKMLYFAMEELESDKGTLDLPPGNHALYLDIENLQERLKSHYSEVFGREVSPEDYAPPESFKKIRGYTTKYYTPKQSDFSSLRDFKRAVRMQGSGILNDGRILRYNGKILDSSSGFSNGVTAAGTNPIPLGTLAAPPWMKKGSIVYLKFSGVNPCNGWYRADDRGGAIKGNHFDLFAGQGKESLYKVGRYIEGKQDVDIFIP